MVLRRLAFLSLAIMGLLAGYAFGQQGGGRGGQKRGNRGAPKWGTRGGGRKGGQRGGRRGPPKESIPACEGLEAKADCSFRSPRGHDVTGQCVPMPRGSNKGTLHCRPERRPGRNRGGNQGGGATGAGKQPRPPQPLQPSRRNSSLTACEGKTEEEACLFRPPVMGDQEARGFKRNQGNTRGGRKGGGGWNKRRQDWKKRRGPPKTARPARPGVCVPWNQTDGTTAHFCRALPADESVPVCDSLVEGDKCNFAVDGDEVYVNLKVATGKQPMAETNGDVLASFFVNGEWTDPELFFSGTEQGEVMGKTFFLTAWPKKVSLTIWSNDAWCFWKMWVNGSVILQDPAGPTGSDSYSKDDDDESYSDSRYWIEGPPASQILDVPRQDMQMKFVQRQEDHDKLHVRIYTGSSAHAGTKGSVFASFMVHDKWTDPELFFAGAAKGQEIEKEFDLVEWPSKVWISTNSSDAYSFWKMTLKWCSKKMHGACYSQDVIEDPAGSGGSQEYDPMGSLDEEDKFWIESPPATQTFGIPARIAPRWSKKHRVRGTCQETWWDMMNGTLHCRSSKREWKPPAAPKKGVKNARFQGNKKMPNRMEPDWSVKSDAPEEESDPIEVQLVVKNVNFDELMANSRMRNDFEMRTKRVIAAEAGQGVYMKHVTLKLSKGSVIVDASINPPSYVSRSYLKKQLADSSVATSLSKTLNALPGLQGVSVGEPTVTVPSQQGRAGKGGKDDDDEEQMIVLGAVAGGAAVVAICMCIVVCVLMKKLKNKAANPEINGTTVAIGRPVQPGQTPASESVEGIPVNPEMNPEKAGGAEKAGEGVKTGKFDM